MNPLAVLEPGGDLATLLYILSFSLFIFGIRQGTHPTSAKQGNLIAAVGMAIAVVTTLLLDGIGNWGIIFGGLLVGGAIGVVASIRVQMTEMPQMVALYNGVGGGAVALISWSEFRHGLEIGSEFPLDEFVPILFAAVIGSVSFWGSNVAFGKLQDLIPTGSVALPWPAGDQRAAAGGRPGRVRGPRHRPRGPLRGALHPRPDRGCGPRRARRAADRRRRHAGRDLAAQRRDRPLRGGGRASRSTTSR